MELESLEAFPFNPGDVVVARVRDRISADQAHRIREQLLAKLPEAGEILVVDGVKVEIHKPEDYGRIHIASDGTPASTVVTVDGKPLDGVVSVSWEIKGMDHLAEATVKFDNVPVQVDGTWKTVDEPTPFTASHDRLVLHRALEGGDGIKGIVLVKCPHLTGLALSIDGPEGEPDWLGLLPCPCNDTSEVIGTLAIDNGCAKCRDSGRCCTDHGKHSSPHLGCILR